MKVIPVILSGGSGTRLWPLSRNYFPKQFLKLIGNLSLFQQSIKRALALEEKNFEVNKIIIVSNEHHRFLVLEQIEELNLKKTVEIILEPEPRNTAPALTLAALSSIQSDYENILIVAPSDHHISNEKLYRQSIHQAVKSAINNNIVTLGVTPTRPDIGYGYIEYDNSNNTSKDVISFIEKPDINSAKQMIAHGNYSWNSGIFILKDSLWLEAIKKGNKLIYENVTKSFKKKAYDNWFLRPDSSSFILSPSDSIDYAVIEHAKKFKLNLKVVLLKSDWSDLGTFTAIGEIEKKDKLGNVFKGDIVSLDSKENIVFSSKRNVSLLGVNDLVVVDTVDSLLIANKNNIQDIKSLVSLLEKKHKHLLDEHIKVNRPWGSYSTIDFDANFKVKRIIVKPNSKLSYQSHNFRSEHWVVVKGLATILCDGNLFDLHENESTFIKKNSKHQLINNQNHSLEIIEVQIGEKVIEEDITRFDDIYGRS